MLVIDYLEHNKTKWPLYIEKNVEKALKNDEPVLALESTIISHGLPYPTNLDLAFELEAIAKEKGVTPATIAVIDGVVKIGLTPSDLEKIAQTGTSCLKLSSFDIPFALGKKLTGTTTVAGTMACAEKAGIRVFSTGGIGGVHREYARFFDVSHDLEALAQHSMIVVSAGAKAILDLPATLEWLETKGVLVAGWKCDEFPGFYYPDTGLHVHVRFDDADSLIRTFSYQTKGSLLVANPIAAEFMISRDVVEPLILKAQDEAVKKGILGKKLTPFLLDALRVATDGASVLCNSHIIRSNVRLGCDLARAFSKRGLD